MENEWRVQNNITYPPEPQPAVLITFREMPDSQLLKCAGRGWLVRIADSLGFRLHIDNLESLLRHLS